MKPPEKGRGRGKVVSYATFLKKKREKKYGTDESRIRRLRAKGFPEDYPRWI